MTHATFVDTSFYVALLTERDADHLSAVSFMRGYRHDFLTTEFVLVEVATFFDHPDGRPTFVRLVGELRTDPRTAIVPASAGLFDRGLELFAARPDKGWSLTDCISFTVMTERGLTDALTADRHFAQAGFAPLLA